jgi:hypothetical protein
VFGLVLIEAARGGNFALRSMCQPCSCDVFSPLELFFAILIFDLLYSNVPVRFGYRVLLTSFLPDPLLSTPLFTSSPLPSFLMGEEEIEALHSLLDDKRSKLPPNAAPFLVAPLYAALPAHEQLRAFEPPPRGTRKIILVRVRVCTCA